MSHSWKPPKCFWDTKCFQGCSPKWGGSGEGSRGADWSRGSQRKNLYRRWAQGLGPMAVCTEGSRQVCLSLSWAHALLKGAIITDSPKIREIFPGGKRQNSRKIPRFWFLIYIYIYYVFFFGGGVGIFLLVLCLSKGIFFLLFMGFLPWMMGSSWNEYRRWAHLAFLLVPDILEFEAVRDSRIIFPKLFPAFFSWNFAWKDSASSKRIKPTRICAAPFE